MAELENQNQPDYGSLVLELTERIDKEILLFESIEAELKKLNERGERLEKEAKEKEAKIAEEERLNKENVEPTTEEKILTFLEESSVTTEENNKIVNENLVKLLSEIESDKESSADNHKNLQTLVTMQKESAKASEEQSNIFITYGVVLIPVTLFLYFMYKFFRQFI